MFFSPTDLGNERESKTRVAVEPELQRDVQSRRLRVVQASARKSNRVANHVVITDLVARLLRQLVPDVEPIAVVLVNALPADLHIHVADQSVTEVVHPAEAVRGRRRARHSRDRHLQVHAVDQITVARDRARHTLAEIRLTVERLLNSLNREVRVATVHHLPESNLGITSQVHILSTIGDELHKTATTHCSLVLFFLSGFVKKAKRKVLFLNKKKNFLHISTKRTHRRMDLI